MASAFAAATLGAAGPGEAAVGFAAPAFTASADVVLAQASPTPDKGAKSEPKKKTKRRSVRCGGPGLPDCKI